jgi:hypothetical protein
MNLPSGIKKNIQFYPYPCNTIKYFLQSVDLFFKSIAQNANIQMQTNTNGTVARIYGFVADTETFHDANVVYGFYLVPSGLFWTWEKMPNIKILKRIAIQKDQEMKRNGK